MGKILIYGATGGIGEASARALQQQGAALHLVGRKAEPLTSLAGELGASFTVADLDDEGAFTRVTEDAAGGGALAGLVFSVGAINLRSLARLTRADFERDYVMNALWAALAVQAAAPALAQKQGGASVVLFSSIAVAQGFSGHASISMAKGAVEALTRSLAAELAPKVRVNCVSPSLTRTPLASKFLANPQMADVIAALHPLPRLGEPADVAHVVALLAGPQSSWITGQVISIDGGRSTLRPKG